MGTVYDDYGLLLQDFIDARISADEFQSRYLGMFKNDDRSLSEPLFGLLDKLFGDVDAFCADPTVRTELQAIHPGFYLDEGQLRQRVVQAAEQLRALKEAKSAG